MTSVDVTPQIEADPTVVDEAEAIVNEMTANPRRTRI